MSSKISNVKDMQQQQSQVIAIFIKNHLNQSIVSIFCAGYLFLMEEFSLYL